MEEVLDTPFYQDDILSRTLTTSVLYDKSSLDLSFPPTCHSDNAKTEHDVPTMIIQQHPNNSESPNLDFLKLGSPDLEKMFMNFQGSETNSPVQDQNVTFSLAANDSICTTENSFTNALQQLHDQQDGPEQASVIEQFPESHEAISLVDGKHSHDLRQHHETIMQHEQRRHLASRRQDISENGYINTSSCNALSNSNMHVASDGTILACSPPGISHRVVPQSLPLALQSQHAQEAVVFHNFNLLNNNPPPMPSQIMRPVEHPNYYGHNMTSFHERETMHNVYEFQMHDGTNQGGPLRGLPQKFHDGGFVEQAMGEPMTLAGIDNMSGMGMEEQPKLYVENSHMQPINLEIQELVKRERKKLRNRIASSKCRKRKLEREARLEDRVKDLKEKNIELNAVSNALKQQVCDLKQRVMDHVSEGCQIVLPPS